MNQYNISAIRKLLKKSFSAEEFDDFCFDYFPSVQEEFTPGMTFSQQITLLLKFCRKSDCFDELLKFVKEKRYIRYRELIDVINTPTSVEMYLDDSDIDYPQSAPEYEKIFDQLFKLNQNIDAFRKENLETTTNKFSPTPLSQEFPQAEMENNELGKISLLHLKAAETAIRQMTQSTHEYNEKLAINNQRLTSYLAHPNKSRRKKGFYSFINGMIQAMNTFANQLESTIPTFSEQHSLAFDAYVREAAYSFSLALDDQIKLNVNLMLEISVVIYKPSLTNSINSTLILRDNTKLLQLPATIASKKLRKNFANANNYLLANLDYNIEVKKKALQHTIEAEAILQSFIRYWQFQGT